MTGWRQLIVLGVLLAACAPPAPSPSSTASSAPMGSATPTPPASPTASPAGSPGVLPDLAITKTAVVSGSTATFTITVSNLVPAVDPGLTMVIDPLPAGLTYQNGSGANWECSVVTWPAGSSTPAVACFSPPLTAGSGWGTGSGGGTYAPITITATVASSASGAVSNCATVHRGATDTFANDADPSNNTSCVGTAPPSTAKGQLCVAKWNDRDADGVRDPGEPYLAGWSFALTNNSTGVASTLATSKAAPKCAKVQVGLYTVAEVLRAGWRQTSPATPGPQTVTVTAGQTATVSFGNTREKCCVTATFNAGRADNFATTDGPEVSVGPNGSSVAVVTFDVPLTDPQYRIELPTEQCIADARYEIRLKATSSTVPGFNALILNVPGYVDSSGVVGVKWVRNLDTLSMAASPPFHWVAGAPAHTFTFGIGSLIGSNNNTSLLTALRQIRVLETLISGATMVDFIRLTVTFCECPVP